MGDKNVIDWFMEHRDWLEHLPKPILVKAWDGLSEEQKIEIVQSLLLATAKAASTYAKS